jgi:predicted ATP-grasp superfamily ATP-dependent carboligase
MVLDRAGRLLAVAQQSSSRLSLRRTSVRARTVDIDDGLVEQVRQMLASLGWFGLANVQLLQPAGDRPQVIDLNGRFYGSLALAVRAGANLPAIWVDDALRRPATPVCRARAGVRFHAFEEDLRRARAERRGGIVRDVGRVVASVPLSAHTTLSLTDPRPGVRRAKALGHSALGHSALGHSALGRSAGARVSRRD